MSHWPFSVLGLEVDADAREIKRAYARKLRTVHPEDDPEGFQALREAYEAAASGRWSKAIDVADLVPQERGSAGETSPASPPAERSPPPARRTLVPESPSAEEELVELRQALFDLVVDEAATDEARKTAARAVLNSPALENVGALTTTEAWFGGLILENPGPADSLVDLAIDRFAWDRHERQWNMPWYVAAALQRRDALQFKGRLRDPKGPYYKGYRLLQQPPGNGWAVFAGAGKIRPVLKLLDTAPGLMSEFDYEAVQQWHERIEKMPFRTPASWGSAWRLVFLICWVGFMLFKCVLPEGPDNRPPAAQSSALSSLGPILQCRAQARATVLDAQAAEACAGSQTSLSVLSDRAYIRLRQGGLAEPIELWTEVLRISPTDARALYGRGIALWLLGKHGPARSDIERALATDPVVAAAFAKDGFNQAKHVLPAADLTAPERLLEIKRQPHVRPVWLQRPSGAQLGRHYPSLAAERGTGGRVNLDCFIDNGGRLVDCVVVAEQPQDLGMADAALDLTSYFRVDITRAPQETRVSFAITFQMEEA